MANRVGERLGNYRLVRLLGQGGFAEVYLGEHVYLNTQAAVKVLHTQLTGSEKDKFQAEARTVAHLKHPNIVQVREFGIDGDVPFLIMSYAPNGNLRQRHPLGKPLPLPTILHYLKQVTEALQYIHDQKMIHRDIKPHNMLLGADNEVLLSDFGLALIVLSSRHDSLQSLAGTVSYMAPEQLQGKPRLASDQYSLGIVIYEWLSGDLPFKGSFSEIASQHLLIPPPPLHERVSTIPPAVEEVVMTALSKDPQKRFASIQAFARAFEQSCLPLLSTPAVDLKSHSPQLSTTSVLADDDAFPLNTGHQNDVAIQSAPSVVSDDPTKLRSQPLFALAEGNVSGASRPRPVEFSTNAEAQSTSDPALMKGRQIPRRRSRLTLLTIVSTLLVAAILALAGLRYFAFQTVKAPTSTVTTSASAVTINFGPKVQSFSDVFTLTATPTAQSVDVNRAIIPLKNATSSLSASQTGPASGPVCRHNGCVPSVMQRDVDSLVAQMQPGLERQLTQNLQKQVSNTKGTQTGSISFTTVSVVPTPPVGGAGPYVTVALTEQGIVSYVVNSDAQSVARQALVNKVHQFGADYLLVSNTVTVGQPVAQSINASANSVTMAVAAGGVGVYQFPASKVQLIKASLAGKTVSEARTFLANQPGIDQQTIAIRFIQGSGNTLPSDIQHITIVLLNASNLPSIQLQTIPTPHT
jgi:serine/threonine protein kinase